MYRVRLSFNFEMAHQLDTAFSNACTDCIHGHSYKLEVLVQSGELNPDGMVIDFGKLKSIFNETVQFFDHAILLPTAVAQRALKMKRTKRCKSLSIRAMEVFGKKTVVCDWNPTAEAMAKWFYETLSGKLRLLVQSELHVYPNQPQLVLVRVQETDRGWAEYYE